MGHIRLYSYGKRKLNYCVGFNVEISTSTVGLHMVLTEHFYFNIYSNALNMLNALCLAYFDVLVKHLCPSTVPRSLADV